MKVPGGFTSWWRWLTGKAFPLTFFSLVLAIGSLTIPQQALQITHEGMRLYLVMALLRHWLILGFLLLIVAAYLTRTNAKDPAQGFREKVFPILVAFAPPVGMWVLGHTGAPQRLDLVGVGLLITLLGHSVSLWALWHLRGSFAIMAEARPPVMSGPYRYIRHPLYLGEMLMLLGLCLAISTAAAIFFWAIWTAMQLTRARVEETKLVHQFSDYRAYRERSRFILPGLY